MNKPRSHKIMIEENGGVLMALCESGRCLSVCVCWSVTTLQLSDRVHNVNHYSMRSRLRAPVPSHNNLFPVLINKPPGPVSSSENVLTCVYPRILYISDLLQHFNTHSYIHTYGQTLTHIYVDRVRGLFREQAPVQNVLVGVADLI